MNFKSAGLSTFKKREKIDGWLFVLPFVISYLIFFVGPLIVAFILSFKEYSFLDQISIMEAKWVGLDNYIHAFKDPVFRKALLNTTIYSIGVVPTQLIIALVLALIVNSDIKGKTFFRAAYYIPTVTSTVAVSVMFMFIFKTDGLLNKILQTFGFEAYNWFGDINLALPSIMMMAVWSSVGLYMIIFLAGLQDIPDSLYEAALIDGANKWQQFWHVTLPLLRPTFFFNLVVSMIGTFQVFDQAYVVSGGNGGPLNSTMTVVLYLYRTGFRDYKMGYACAIAFILFSIIFVLTMIQKKLFGEETQY
ncbi:carbohydrate ABC transporter membrane protein 1, CUT1 family (TC 3.A.1.1.-) [Alkalithermobacter thermoalcaliphilus JW-YL-7 = DSM 7308]|uniref:ABC-type transporter, integral membrane subunit n=1 Tax=Alkalithermobacter thermoalcaliphilus JW-YL-7 = DSM 7308 TaxID=1121328 RepID=A0A150FNP4_CLOPD|nr:ABC-type transporter, integral membrane subunit [[Clostridium] paradoxum JW-YL-7 = DSM 7308]SHK85746.1 carbohydrate ABC transporter membrane protein 1, CUT1 family (TC 3.A.1.1.-) [[Clostridium] paradoxum JW-YL-7 = DSM 7308]